MIPENRDAPAEVRAIRPSRPPPRPRAPGAGRAARALLGALLGLAPALGAQPDGAGSGPAPTLAHLTVEENRGTFRPGHPVTSGIPFGRGRVADVGALDVVDADSGARLVSQWRVLSRWPDGSLRWALLDARTPLPAHATRTLAIRLDRSAPDPAPDPFTLSTDGEGVVWLDDGATRWPLLRRDPGGDEIAGLAARLVGRLGHVYRSVVTEGPVALERGPVRAAFELRGRHEPVGEPDGALPVPFHTFTARVHVLAGTGTARVEWSLENGDLDEPTGRLGFRAYTLRLAPLADAYEIHLPASSERRDVLFELRQDGAARERWSWRVGERRWVPRTDEDLWAGLLRDGRGHYAHLVDSAPNHPSALRHATGGPLEIDVLADGAGEEFFLDDATRKTFRITLARDVSRAGRAFVQSAADPIEPRLDPREVAATRAWGDAGALFVPAPRAMTSVPLGVPRDAPTGWAHWGEWRARSTRTSGSPRNRLSVYLEALQSGRVDARRAARARAHHAMDLRPYHIRGFVTDEHPDVHLYEGVPHPNDPPEHSLGRKSIDPALDPWRRRLPPRGHGYNGFDPEHMTLDDVYEHWLLTGSWPAHDALRSAGEAMLTWHAVRPGRPLWSSRATGWTLRALVQVHRATGEARFVEAARRIVDKIERERGRGDVTYLHRHPPDPRHVEDAEWDAPWMVAIAVHGLVAYHAETGDERVPAILSDLVAFIMSGWTGQGFLESIAVDDASPSGVDPQPAGTSQWIPGALAAAATVTGDHGPVDTVYPLYASLREAHVTFGRPTWHWWQPYLEDIATRHGPLAVTSPSVFGARRAR